MMRTDERLGGEGVSKYLQALLVCLLTVTLAPSAFAGCNAGKGFACWWSISTCGLAGLGGRDKYVECVAALSKGWCTECVLPDAPDPNCPVGSHMQGNVCVPEFVAGLTVAGPPGYSGRSVAPNADGRLELAGIDAGGRVSHLWQDSPSGKFVASSAPFPGGVSATAFPVLVQRLDGRLDAFVMSAAGVVTHSTQVAPNVNWNNWAGIGNRQFDTSGVAAGVSPSGSVFVSAVASDGTMWYASERAGQWSAWKEASGARLAGTPVMANNGDGRLEIFAFAMDGRLMHAWQAAEDADFGAWTELATGPFKGTPAAVRNLDQRLEVFVTTRSGKLAHVWQTEPNGGWSAPAESEGVHQFDPVAHINADGTLSVFVVGVADRAVWTRRQTQPNSGWGNWKSLGGTVRSAPAVGRNANGSLSVFAVGQDGKIWSTTQTQPSSTAWQPWTRLGITASRM